MSVKHHCDRCDAIADPRRVNARPDEAQTRIPDRWRVTTIRDESDTSNLEPQSERVVLCVDCDRDLVRWFNRTRPYEVVREAP